MPKSTLADELAEFAVTEIEKPNACRIARLLDEIGPEAAAVLADMLDNSSRPGAQIAAFMASKGHEIQPGKYQDHRRRDRGEGCRCPKAGA